MPELSEEVRIWHLIIADHQAWWMRDFEAFAKFHVRAPTDRWWAGLMSHGITRNNGWDTIERQGRREMAIDPDPNPFFAYHSKFEERNLRVVGDMAWATFDCVYPTSDLPGFRGPAVAHEIRILERHEGAWKIALVALMDDQFAQTETPIWRIDTSGNVLEQNPAATRFLAVESELVVRAGHIHLRDPATDHRLYLEIAKAAAADAGIMVPRISTPIVFDPGNDLPARIWWVNATSGRLYVSFNDQSLLPPRLERASAAFRLSPAQHRLGTSIVEGLSLIEAARKEGIRPSTARTQLQRIFDKVGVRTQPGLVRTLLSVTEPK